MLSEFAGGSREGREVDSVVSVNVLEHVEDDEEELALMRSLLRPGGHLCLWVPALSALYAPYDRALGHHRRYQRRRTRG
ncbi:methyltransferase domain-containing protein [Candidatus Palauibacter sp.]|uniref:methyltransferase domain-containing protein n=1 Tax=Candidatus Palauibacter sp. TaxID=3101350 RepID=UPI003B02410A